MAFPYDWDIATVDEIMEYYAGSEGVDVGSLPEKLEDANAPVPVRVDRFPDYNGSGLER